MTDETFSYHVNEEKNDFSNLIYNVIGDVTLAENLRKTINKKDTSKKIKLRLTYLKKKNKNK